MKTLRPSEERGRANHGWLRATHTFSFADYYDPQNMGFRDLRVINEDVVAAGSGFPTHGHRDMEIITYIIEGALEHQDSMGHKEVIRPGEVQRMSAGTGVRHSEYNPSQEGQVHLLQIWILPKKEGIAPSYAQKDFSKSVSEKGWVLAVSEKEEEGSLGVNQDMKLFVAKFADKKTKDVSIAPGRHLWIQLVKGELLAGDIQMRAGDGLAVSNETSLKLESIGTSEFLVFDLA